MFSEILKVKPQLDQATLNRMAHDLTRRFANIAKRFGQGLKNALRLAPMFAIAGAVLSKLLNPLKKAEEVLERILATGADAVDAAEDLGSDPGTFLRLQSVAQAKGVDEQTLKDLLSKFQVALAREQQAAKDPTSEAGALRQFVSETDTAEAFFKFIQSLQKIQKDQQVIVQAQIFGERVRGKAAAFLNETDFERILSRLPTAQALSTSAFKVDAIADEKDILTAVREAQDFVNKSSIANEGMIATIDQAEKRRLQSEDEDLKRFDDLKQISSSVQELTNQFNSFATEFLKTTAPTIVDGVKEISEGFKIIRPFLSEGLDNLMLGVNKGIEAVANLSFKIENLFNEFKNSRVYKYFGGK